MNTSEWIVTLAVVGTLTFALLNDDDTARAMPPVPVGISVPPGAIIWHDGDSGRIGDQRFRLEGVDAPETGGVGSVGGAACEAERAMGESARAGMQAITDRHGVQVFSLYEDRYGRTVVKLWVDGQRLAVTGIERGWLGVWPHDETGRALGPKPEWCGS